MYKKIGKRIFDIILAGGFLIILSPVFFIIFSTLLIYNRGQVFFVQPRIGFMNRSFIIFKFRTMNEKKDDNNMLLDDDQRLTDFGLFLRKYSLDELPQLLNILKGDMSMVGPRPLLCEYLPLYNENQIKRHNVLPGITGLAQINGRNNLSWKERFYWDLKYSNEISFELDLHILFVTFKKLFTGTDIHGDVISRKFIADL